MKKRYLVHVRSMHLIFHAEVEVLIDEIIKEGKHRRRWLCLAKASLFISETNQYSLDLTPPFVFHCPYHMGLNFLSVTPTHNYLSPVAAPHTQNLHHSNKDVQEIECKTDALVDNIALDKSALSHARMVQDLLDVVERESSKDSKTTVQPDSLRPHQRPCSSGWQDEGREARERNDCDTRK